VIGWRYFRVCDGVSVAFFFVWIGFVVRLCPMAELLVAGDAVACTD
jgi:hypothetical protein